LKKSKTAFLLRVLQTLATYQFITVIHYILPAEPTPVSDCRNPEARDGKL